MSNRFYTLDGVRIDQVPTASKPGQFRKPTTKDAAKNGWVVSVTSYLSILKKQKMDESKERRITEAAFCYQPQPGEAPEAYHERIMQQALGEWDTKRDKGTEFHKAIELALNDQEYDAAWDKHVAAARGWLINNHIAVEQTEKTLVSPSHGFAGTTDLVYSRPGFRGIGDFKTTHTKPGEKMKPWPTYQMQLAAYVVAEYGTIHEDSEGFILMVSVNEPGRVEGFYYDSQQLWWGWKAFNGLMDAWAFVHNYNPKTAVGRAA